MDIYRFRLPGFERPYTRQARNHAYVVHLHTHRKSPEELDESHRELLELVRSAGAKVVGETKGFIASPSPAYFVRGGKMEEIRTESLKHQADVVIFNVDLTPGQEGNLEKEIGLPVIDRAGIILEIFGRRANSKEGKLQVELAQLHYALPRLGGLGTVMSRLGGGTGTRGPGEQELERDRRKVRRRIQRVKMELEKVVKHRDLIRAGRKKKNLVTIALAGYTNAGKSTLLNTLTDAGTLVEDKMFATLDPKARMRQQPDLPRFLFVDTVGFINHLPKTLMDSFKATLEEVVEADVIVHVLDISVKNAEQNKKWVEEILEELGASRKPTLLVLNKADAVHETVREELKERWPGSILISAREKWGIHELLSRLETFDRSIRLQEG